MMHIHVVISMIDTERHCVRLWCTDYKMIWCTKPKWVSIPPLYCLRSWGTQADIVLKAADRFTRAYSFPNQSQVSTFKYVGCSTGCEGLAYHYKTCAVHLLGNHLVESVLQIQLYAPRFMMLMRENHLLLYRLLLPHTVRDMVKKSKVTKFNLLTSPSKALSNV